MYHLMPGVHLTPRNPALRPGLQRLSGSSFLRQAMGLRRHLPGPLGKELPGNLLAYHRKTVRLIGLAAVSLVAFVSLAQPPLIRVPVRVVTVPAAVTSGDGHSVLGLRKKDFNLFDNDKEQKIDLDYIDQPISLAIVVQNNDAVRAWLPQVRRIPSLIEALVLGERGEASVSTFSDEIATLQPLTNSSALLDNAFQSINASIQDRSRTLDAVRNAAMELGRVPVQRHRVILLIGQAQDIGSTSSLSGVLELLETENIAVYSVVMPRAGKDLVQRSISVEDAKTAFKRNDTGFVGKIDLGVLVPEIFRAARASAGTDDLTLVTSELGGRQISFRTLHDLEMALSTIAEELHNEYVLTYTPIPSDPGYHRIQVRVKHSGFTVRARPGYYVPLPDAQ